MYQIKALGVVGGALGRNAKLKFQHKITEKSVFLMYQYTFWNFSFVNTINCNFAFDPMFDPMFDPKFDPIFDPIFYLIIK